MKAGNTTAVMLLAVLLTSGAVSAALPGAYKTIADSIKAVLCNFYNVFWNIIGLLGVVVILAAGVEWVISRDDPGKRKMAQNIIIVTIIGLLLAAIAIKLIDDVAATVGVSLVDVACTKPT